MATVDASSCPVCKAPPGSLVITDEFACKDVGEFSLAGVQVKFAAELHPVLTCRACPLRVVGRYDGQHVMFPDPRKTAGAVQP